ncbi:hypothetical protein Pmani_025114 [Petrolisthes manimaculis]|uniref:legumain n=1 Tax=Petrolisthes manimaculis TaxID=1843537 RepID=A0AAE1P7C8_9EUCA|nr:hypothetical protein Pmani_025114 [Petrolisthes manimaculis]
MTWRGVMLLALVVVVVVVKADLITSNWLEEAQKEGNQGQVWAVLVAGSSGWYNYRHQADVCHAYQILHSHGIPDDHIIVMMYDDIAHNEQNPTPGKIINRPNGPNVYEGIMKDYTGEDVTPQNFLKVLAGDKEGLRGVGSGKVLESGPHDRVFINMVDHGAPGIFAFPNEYLNATDLSNAILDLHQKKKYHQLVMYVESCESGSLFQNLLLDDIEVYALSASSPDQHSYACYMDDDLMTYLGDVFSVKWMEDTDVENLHQETLKHQYHLVRQEVTTSTVMHWGELRLGGQKLSRFLGNVQPHILPPRPTYSPSRQDDPCLSSAIASPDVPIGIFKAQWMQAKTPSAKQYWLEQLEALRMNRLFMKVVMWKLVAEVTGDRTQASLLTNTDHHHSITRWPCYTESVRAFHDNCFNLAKNPYATRLLKSLVNLCEHGYKSESVRAATTAVCVHSNFPPVL